MESGLLRKRLRQEIDAARRAAAERRERAGAAQRRYDAWLEEVAIPAFRAMATVLRAESLPFEVQTPSGSVRLVSDRQRDDAIELALDTTLDPPQPMLLISQTRGSRTLRTERALTDRPALESITEDEVIEQLLLALRPWLA